MQYGIYPFYLLMYPTLFVLAVIGYNALKIQINFVVAAYVEESKLLCGGAHNPEVTTHLELCPGLTRACDGGNPCHPYLLCLQPASTYRDEGEGRGRGLVSLEPCVW